MSNILEIVESRGHVPLPWEQGDNIPWHEEGFSRRMLAEHLSQEHDAASRRIEVIDRHIEWINTRVLENQPTRVLDLACGPGLYSSRLARLGNSCVGIDYSPASIEYARQQASADELDCVYMFGDIRQVDYGGPYGLAMLIFGEFNIFRPADIAHVLTKTNRALNQGGYLVIEPHTYEAVKQMGSGSPSWSASSSGLFSENPHILLHETFWDIRFQTSTTRFFMIDAASGEMTRFAQSFQAYTIEDYKALLENHGFGQIEHVPALTGKPDAESKDLFVIVARKVKSV